jgi:hypothetical protein
VKFMSESDNKNTELDLNQPVNPEFDEGSRPKAAIDSSSALIRQESVIDDSSLISTNNPDRPIVWLRDDDDRLYRELSWKLRKGESEFFTFESEETPSDVDNQMGEILVRTKDVEPPESEEDSIDIFNDAPAKHANGQFAVVEERESLPLTDIDLPVESERDNIDLLMDDQYDPFLNNSVEESESDTADTTINLSSEQNVAYNEPLVNNQSDNTFEVPAIENTIPEQTDDQSLDFGRDLIQENLNGAKDEWMPDSTAVEVYKEQKETESKKELQVAHQPFETKPTPADLKRKSQIEALNKKLQSVLARHKIEKSHAQNESVEDNK